MAYRPLAIYFAQLQQAAQTAHAEESAIVVEPAEAQTATQGA
jgi:hypothetical protein